MLVNIIVHVFLTLLRRSSLSVKGKSISILLEALGPKAGFPSLTGNSCERVYYSQPQFKVICDLSVIELFIVDYLILRDQMGSVDLE